MLESKHESFRKLKKIEVVQLHFEILATSKNTQYISEGFTVDNSPLVQFFGKKKGGLSGRKFFVKVFLCKKFLALRAAKKKGGLSTVKPSDKLLFLR